MKGKRDVDVVSFPYIKTVVRDFLHPSSIISFTDINAGVNSTYIPSPIPSYTYLLIPSPSYTHSLVLLHNTYTSTEHLPPISTVYLTGGWM